MREIAEIKAELERASRITNSTYCGEVYREAENQAIKLRYELFSTITSGIPLDRLEAICQAERDGRCVVLPCKVGDMVYVLDTWSNNPYIFKTTAKDIKIDGTLICYEGVDVWFKKQFLDFGKTVFLTREEAEAALTAMKESPNGN